MDGIVAEGVCVGEDAAREWFIALHGRVVHSLYHVDLLCLVAEDASRCLILVHEGQFAACLVQQDLMNHSVRALRVDNTSVESYEPQSNHNRQHDWVCPVEWVLFNENSE
jgi:hypothetical protein